MNFPVEIEIGKLSIPLHLIMEILAFTLGYQLYLFLRKNKDDSISGTNRFFIIVGAAIGALLGSRLIGALENPIALFDSQKTWTTILLQVYMSKTIVGGLLGGLLGVELIKKAIGETQSSGDLFTFPIILGIILGRIGCFSMGVYEPTYGLPTSFFMGMDLGDGLSRHPTSLYEIIFLVVIGLFLWRLFQQQTLQNGVIFKIFMIGYLSFRLFIDFIKPKEELFVVFNSIQIVCILGLLYYHKTIWQIITGKLLPL